MKMYRCKECGHLFEEGEEVKFQESRGECFGFPAYEQMSGCPLCNGDFVSVEPCKICGGYDLNDDEEFCKHCLKDVSNRLEDLLFSNFDEKELEAIKFLIEGYEL